MENTNEEEIKIIQERILKLQEHIENLEFKLLYEIEIIKQKIEI